ncbi:HAMP domain-containing sensor histidine kinase [Crossiella sp. CA198]|uniref:HAMP domain-containing sensor histidine kinase n=1 Tax=Crossiella sp. CA198 TaxID=3455607 RepID=UPI003F8D6F8F
MSTWLARLRAARWRELSLRGRLIVLVAGAVAVAVAAVSLGSWLLVRAKLEQNFDNQLRSYSQLAGDRATPKDALDALHDVDRPEGDSDGRRPRPDRTGDIFVQFLDPGGTPVRFAGREEAVPVSAGAAKVADRSIAEFSEDRLLDNDLYRVWTAPRPDGGAVQVGKEIQGLRETLGVLGFWHILVCLAGVAVAAGVGLIVARTALRPVDALTAGAERVARTQDLDQGISVQGTGEIARLAEAFNAMLAALAVSRDAQRRLVEDAGHELRTPLTSLRNNIELLAHATRQTDPARVLPAEDRDRLLTDLEVQAGELTSLVSELVELAKTDRSTEPERRVDLAEVVAAAVERVRPRAPNLLFRTDLRSAEIIGRPRSLQRAVLNLLDNAAKWSPLGGTVTVTLETGGDQVRIVVDDEGPGIPEADLPHVFQRFYRADTARALPGSGLGLAIVDQIATLHGGSATASRNAVGGARVSLTLPAAATDS